MKIPEQVRRLVVMNGVLIGAALVGRFYLIPPVLIDSDQHWASTIERQRAIGAPPAGTHQDDTPGAEWIKRLERPERIAGLKIDEVIAALGLQPGMVIADIGSGTGAFTIPFAKAVAPGGRAIAVDIWPELLEYVKQKAASAGAGNLETVLAAIDDPGLPALQVDIAFFHDVFHNTNDRTGYLRVLSSRLKPGARIAIIEQEYDDPIAKKWDQDEDRITPQQVAEWMATIGFEKKAAFDLFQGANNPTGTGMPERWFVVYGKAGPQTSRSQRACQAGGEAGIRTLGAREGSTVFKTAAIDRSATSPRRLPF